MSLYWYPIQGYEWEVRDGLTVTLYTSYLNNQLSMTPLIIPPGKKDACLDITDAMKLMFNLVQSYNRTEAVANTRNKIMFTRTYPGLLFDSEIQAEPTDTNRVITWNLTKRQPGSLSAQPFGKPQELKPRFREEVSVKDIDGNVHHLEIRGQWWDNLIRYECWAPTAAEADDLVDFFENFITETSNYIMRSGVQKVILTGRGSEGQFSGRTKWFFRTLNVYYRTEKLTFNVTRAIDQIIEYPIVFVDNLKLHPITISNNNP